MSFGFPASMSDLNILNVIPHLIDVLTDKFPGVRPSYYIYGEPFDWFYYLSDGIYPNCKTFISSISKAFSKKEKKLPLYKKLRKNALNACLEFF